MGQSGFLGVHSSQNNEASLGKTFLSFSFLEFSQGLEKPRKFHSFFCVPLSPVAHVPLSPI